LGTGGVIFLFPGVILVVLIDIDALTLRPYFDEANFKSVQGKTCIDCHQGIAHKLSPNAHKAYEDMLANIDNVGPVQKLIDFLQDADVARAKAIGGR
jgi:hypothetical protein